MLDFPRLMLRHKAQRARRDGIPLQDRLLGEPQKLGKMASGPMAPLMNFVSESRLLRKVQQAVTGISADFNLPPFARTPLREWFDRHEPDPNAGEHGEVVLFSTCTSNYNMPTTGIAAVQVLEHNGLAVHYPAEQTCCGMPNMDGGDVAAAQDKARQNVQTLLPFVERGMSIVVPGPTCSYVIKKEYPELLGTEAARNVAESTFDLMEFLRMKWRDKTLNREFVNPLGHVAYHAACHLRAQKIGAPGRILLSKVPDTEVDVVEECSAVDGTWGMKAQFYELGEQYARKLIGGLRDVQYTAVATDCPLSGQRIAQDLGTAAYHPIELLNRAYGLPEVTPASPEKKRPPELAAGAPGESR
jgi:glycerol-3-phosphate dehydrogenase subunit C